MSTVSMIEPDSDGVESVTPTFLSATTSEGETGSTVSMRGAVSSESESEERSITKKPKADSVEEQPHSEIKTVFKVDVTTASRMESAPLNVTAGSEELLTATVPPAHSPTETLASVASVAATLASTPPSLTGGKPVTEGEESTDTGLHMDHTVVGEPVEIPGRLLKIKRHLFHIYTVGRHMNNTLF